MARAPVLLLAAVLALALGCTPALAASGDTAATQELIRANYALVQAARSNMGTSEAALKSLLRGVRRECPKVAASSPQNLDSEHLSNELILTMRVVAVRPDARAVAGFARSVQGLRWSNRTLTSTVREYASNVKALSLLAEPKLCSDIRAWVLSGFQTLSPNSVRANQQFYTIGVAVGLLPPAGLLAPSEVRSETAMLARTEVLESQLAEGEARAAETYSELMEALALNP